MKGPAPRRLWKYVAHGLRSKSFLESPGDRRKQPRIPARATIRALLLGQMLRQGSFAGIEALVRSAARGNRDVARRFGDDALACFTERLDPAGTRAAAITALRRAKRNKAFDNCRFIGMAVDGTGAGHSREKGRPLCRPFRHPAKQIVGYGHPLAMIGMVGTGWSLPFDVEPYGPGDSEYAAGQR